jgi:hypothetical protein
LLQDHYGVWQGGPYFAYLDQIRDRLPVAVAEYATRVEHYTLDSHESLHDAWLEIVEVLEPATGARLEERTTDVAIRLLGGYHDRRHELIYHGVQSYKVTAPVTARGHGDLLVHEFRLNDRGQPEHELLFSTGATIEVAFTGFEYRELAFEGSKPAV